MATLLALFISFFFLSDTLHTSLLRERSYKMKHLVMITQNINKLDSDFCVTLMPRHQGERFPT